MMGKDVGEDLLADGRGLRELAVGPETFFCIEETDTGEEGRGVVFTFFE